MEARGNWEAHSGLPTVTAASMTLPFHRPLVRLQRALPCLPALEPTPAHPRKVGTANRSAHLSQTQKPRL